MAESSSPLILLPVIATVYKFQCSDRKTKQIKRIRGDDDSVTDSFT